MNTQASTAGAAITLLTFALLAVVVIGTGVLVLPVYLEVYAGAGWQLPWPTRFAFGMGHPGILVAALGLGCGIVAFRLRGPDHAAARLAVCAGANLLLTVFFLAQVWVLVDFAARPR